MTESTRILTGQELTNEDRHFLSILENHINDEEDNFCCPQFYLMKNISYFRKQKIDCYIIKISTIGEDRWQKKKMGPYHGDGEYPNRPAADIWEDYQFEVPTSAQIQLEMSLNKDLRETRHKDNCPDCYLKTNNNLCQRCNNTSSVETWQQLTVRWTNEKSTVIGFSQEPCLLPESKIEQETNLDVVLQFDDVWSMNEKSLDSILERVPNLPPQIRQKINQKFLYKHHQKAMPIRRLSLTIQHLPIVQCQYHLSHTPGKTFTFCIYGRNQRLYVIDETSPSIIQRLREQCSIC